VVVAYQIAAFLSESMGDPGLDRKAEAGKYLGALNLIPPALERSLALEPAVRQLAEKFAGVKRVFVIGSGPNRTTASEIALKFKEAVLLASEGFGAEEAFHGPIASLNEDTLVIGVSTPGPGYDKVGHFLKAVAHMGYPAVSVTPEPYDLDGVDTIRVNTDGIPEIFSGTVLVYPLYMLAYFSALARGLNPDIFRVGDEVFHEAMALVPSISYKV
jgi:glucosamine--fructose-6-phosphate aminotransferase (isomerizing)